jgi:hypothetical protein
MMLLCSMNCCDDSIHDTCLPHHAMLGTPGSCDDHDHPWHLTACCCHLTHAALTRLLTLCLCLCSYTVQETLAGEFRELANAPPRRLQQLRLPRPISPIATQEADGNPFCAESQRLQDLSANPGDWSFGSDRNHNSCPHENCHAYSYKAQGAGHTMMLTLDTTLQDNNNPPGSPDLEGRYLVVLYAQDWRAGKMGAARVRCVSGCSCRTMVLEPSVASHQVNSIMGSDRVEVSCCFGQTVDLQDTDRCWSNLVKLWSNLSSTLPKLVTPCLRASAMQMTGVHNNSLYSSEVQDSRDTDTFSRPKYLLNISLPVASEAECGYSCTCCR